MNLRRIPALVCLTTGAVLSFSSSAHAITFTTSTSSPNVSPVAAGNGVFTSVSGANTIADFNLGTSPAPAPNAGITGVSYTVMFYTCGLGIKQNAQTHDD